ncbi:hypothetical protein EJD96_09245 [Herbaspirillum seropedicae]|nr:hypothetical protein EJD96_09245 [Herbaspirillum seropedicae]
MHSATWKDWNNLAALRELAARRSIQGPGRADRPGFFVFNPATPSFPKENNVHRPASAITVALALLALGGILAACSASREPQATAAADPADAAASQCDAGKVQRWIGEDLSGYVERQAAAESGAQETRVLKPGDVATMDFNPRRLNIHVDPGGVIIKLACG